MSVLERLARLENVVGLDVEGDSEPEDECWGCEEDDQPGMLIKSIPGCPVHDTEPTRNVELDAYREKMRSFVLELRAVADRHGSVEAAERIQAYDNVLRYL